MSKAAAATALCWAFFAATANATERVVEAGSSGATLIEDAGVPGLTLRLVSVISDERCPARVTCSWANPAVIVLEASAPDSPPLSFELSLDIRRKALRALYRGASFEYVDLLPAPQVPEEFAKLKPLETYTAVVRVNGPDKP